MVSKRSMIVIIVVVVLIVSAFAIGITELNSQKKTSSTTTPQTKNSLTVEEGLPPDSLDPAVTYTTPGWEVMNQVYQGLVAPNGTSMTSFVGVLAYNWSISSNGMNYTFYLRHNVTFSNGDQFTAYDIWFSVYRTIIMDQAPSWIMSQNLAPGNGVNFNITASILNDINYTDPNSTDLNYMEYPNQSIQVINPYELIIHLGYGYNGNVPYNAFLMTLTTPMAAAVDPRVVEAHGGVQAGTPNSWMESNAIGTGFYEIFSYNPSQGVTLTENPTYWAKYVPQNQWNYAIQPPYLKTIIILYKSLSSRISDLKSGNAQIIEAPVQDYSSLKGIPNVNVSLLPIQFGSSQDAYFVYMDPYAFSPFQNIDVRKAVTFAINYQGIISTVFDGYAKQWIGPVPPGFPDYNQSIAGLSFYPYNATMAAEYLAQAGYRATLPNGTVLNPSGNKFPSVNFLYTSDSTSEIETAQIIQSNLAAIGINIVLTPLTMTSYTSEVFSNATNSTQYPMGINFYTEDYSASIDYVDALADGDYVGTSAYFNESVFNATVNASATFNNSAIIQNFSFITQTMYNQYVMPWLYVPYFLSITQSDVTGIIPNPAGSGAGYFMFYNTVHYT
ncbi:MAG: ABC transporter substrate-binding protein [Thermoplasmata archaeon]